MDCLKLSLVLYGYIRLNKFRELIQSWIADSVFLVFDSIIFHLHAYFRYDKKNRKNYLRKIVNPKSCPDI